MQYWIKWPIAKISWDRYKFSKPQTSLEVQRWYSQWNQYCTNVTHTHPTHTHTHKHTLQVFANIAVMVGTTY